MSPSVPERSPRDGTLLISTSTFPLSRSDGSPRFVWDLAHSLSQHVETSVLAPGAPGAPRKEVWDGVRVQRFRYFVPSSLQRLAYGDGMRDNLRRSAWAKLQVLPFLAAQASSVRRLTGPTGARFVNSHWLVPQGLTAAWARGRTPRFHHILHVHAADVYMLAEVPLGRQIVRYVMERTDAVFADGSHVRSALDELLGHSSGAVLQPNGVYTEKFSPDQLRLRPSTIDFQDGYLAFVGRLVEKKGVVYLLRAMTLVRERFPGLGLVLIGYGPLEAELRAEATRLGLDDSVRFAGQKSHQEIVDYLHHCKLAVVPSIIDSHGETEGMPTVVLEAMAAGCRVVASAVDGIPDVVRHRDNGWLCREKDPIDLADKLMTALDDPNGKAVREQALQTASQFDWSEVAQHYLETMKGLR